MHDAGPWRNPAARVIPVAIAALAAGIFFADTIAGAAVVLSMLYVAVVLLAARFYRTRGILIVAAACVGLSALSYPLSGESAVNASISIVAIALTTVLALQRGRAEQRRDALYAVTHVLAEVEDLTAAAPDLLQPIGENLQWDWGALWSFAPGFDREGTEMRCHALWHAPGVETAAFDNASRERIFVIDEGRVGEVWRRAAPVWIVDATTDRGFLRASAAAKSGLHGGVIFPILLDREILGMVEFFSRAPRRRDEEQLATLSVIGSQIGQFIKRRRAEMSVRAAEERWRKLFETSVAGMALVGLDGVCTAANPALQRMLGRSEAELVGHSFVELNHEDERAATAAAFVEFRSGRLQERHSEKKYLKPDGTQIWLNITTTVVAATGPADAFLQVVYVDVTRRVETEAALRASEERWRRLFETSSAGMALAGLDGVFTAANPALQRMLGRTEQEIVGHSVAELTHPDHRAETAAVIARFKNGLQQEYKAEKRYLRADGSPVWLNITTTLVPATETAAPLLQAIYIDVTERKQAEEALRASEERWRTVFESAAVGIRTGVVGGPFLSANAAYQRMLGYTEDELRNLKAVDLTHEDERAEAQRRVNAAADGASRSYRVEKRYRRKDGSIVWADVGVSVIPTTDDRPAFLSVVVIDITDRKQAEAALRASEERWRTVFETGAVGIATGGLDGGHFTVNPTFQRMLGYTEAEFRNLKVFDITHDDDRAETRRRLDGIVAGPQGSYRLEKRYRRKDGATVWVDVSASIVPATGSTPAFIAVMAVDISDRKRAEAALRASEERWRAVFEKAMVGIVTLGLDGRYATANASYQRITGYTEDELRQLTVLDLTHEEDRDLIHIVPASPMTARSAPVHEFEKRYRRKDGQVVWAYVSGFVVPATETTQAFVAAIVVDITDRKRAEEALRQAQADLARVNRIMLLGEMTASIAHEINQPIGAVITNANAGLRWLAARPPNLEEVGQALGRIVRDGQRAGAVIHRVRALAKKQLPARRDRSDLNEAIREALALTQAELQRHGVELQMRLSDELPPVPGDRVQLQQVIINLVINAVEAMDGHGDGPRELTISSGAGASNDVFVEVQDTGPGLDPAALDRLFRSFYTTKPEGMGLGLAISRSIIEAHGGQLSAAPNQPQGAVFRFTLPVDAPLSGNAA